MKGSFLEAEAGIRWAQDINRHFRLEYAVGRETSKKRRIFSTGCNESNILQRISHRMVTSKTKHQTLCVDTTRRTVGRKKKKKEDIQENKMDPVAIF